jgi:endonuclease YncB( thermonuclease family)
MLRLVTIPLTFIAISASAGADNPIIGQASVIDGDTIEIHKTRIRLHGIDAPESGQTCLVDGKVFRCGQRSASALADKIGSQTVTCDQNGTDKYGRVVAVCSAGGEDLNAWMVAEGQALAYRQYSKEYVIHEGVASTAKRGMWQGEFVAPWDWRRDKRIADAKADQTRTCRIKGNISRSGERIYHVPRGQYYEKTRITESKGEKWFCTQKDARRAGWRKSKR